MFRFIKYSLGSAALLIGAIGGLGGMNLYTYQRFTSETEVADLAFRRTAPRTFEVTFSPVDGEPRRFLLQGDEWQLDVRMIKWRDWLTFLGEDPLFQLDRLSGRYVETEDMRSGPVTAHDLVAERAIDLWAFARRAGDWLPGIDAAYGASVFLPMADGAAYRVSITPSGLLARSLSVGADS